LLLVLNIKYLQENTIFNAHPKSVHGMLNSNSTGRSVIKMIFIFISVNLIWQIQKTEMQQSSLKKKY